MRGRKFLPVEKQGQLAKALAAKALAEGKELSSSCIEEEFNAALIQPRFIQRLVNEKERAERKAAFMRESYENKMLAHMRKWSRSARNIVFTTTGRTAVSGFSRAKAAIDEAMLAALRESNGVDAETQPWTLHDLRRTAASGMARIGIPPHVIEAALNHKTGTIKGVAAVYNRYSYAAEKRQALSAWSRRLAAVISGEAPSNVVALAKAKTIAS
jgi:hypothetical protein